MNRTNAPRTHLRKYIDVTIRLALSGIGITLSNLLLMLIGVSIIAGIVNPASLQNPAIFIVIRILTYVLAALLMVLLWLQNRELLRFMGMRQFLQYRWLEFREWLWRVPSNLLFYLRKAIKERLPLGLLLLEFSVAQRRATLILQALRLIKPYLVETFGSDDSDIEKLDRAEEDLSKMEQDLLAILSRAKAGRMKNVSEQLRDLSQILNTAQKTIHLPFVFQR